MRTDDMLLDRARSMRSAMSQPERELWRALRAKRFVGVKFARQVVIGPYIADFVARSARVVIEVDGDTHTDPVRDDRRTVWLVANGYRVIRFGNKDVMENMDGVLYRIGEALAAPLSQPSPHGGEGYPS